ncbi:cytochrome-c oxidase [Bacteriovorax stolpii]|uniref:Cytochrome-c oxidase n=1 Tax=Bacteriovorax stolpii TaxID=960 RepID=A0A2K9NMK7_BACTC|nr:cbb3-type cytochrome c oxidase subunit I [Bacteriovorax stolpii]AUN96738.1 cytochrome-c oxidase [Bacteriovorax stolpii]QDK43331.1 cytochrome-c oxidase [Bacteriovorax stolpii]TDP53739.1 cytochrome c oxidase subunit 1 [Bacteriovorax stolpii]
MAFFEQEIHDAPTTFLSKYVFSFDHKVIAKQFLWYGIAFLGIGGMMALLIRWTLAFPGEPFPVIGPMLFPHTGGVVPPDTYAMLFTLHGTIMIFFAITPILIGAFGNYCIPLLIGARDMVFPTLNMLSFWLAFVSAVLLLASLFTPLGGAAGGWTSYPTLSTLIGSAGVGQTLWCLSLFVLGVSSTMGAVNYIATIITLRAPGMGYFDMPLTIWGLWLTAILNAIFLPVLGAGLLLLTFDRVFGTTFFLAGAAATSGSGDPVLFQHVFWIFGHPEVYILILPAWGIVSDLLSFFARKPAFGAKATALAMTSITILSTLVYGHHMYSTQMSPLLTQSFMMLTMTISIPSAVFFANWLGTLWKGAIRFQTPMLFSLGVVFVFGLGGLTGLYLATVSTDLYLHDTYFVVGHFHYTMAASVLLGGFAATYFWFPKMFGRMMNETLGKWHFWISMIGLNGIFMGMMIIGHAGMHRRIYNPFVYEFLQNLIPLNMFITISALTMGAAQLFFVYNFVYSMFKGPIATQNPWEVGTLEWTIPSPAPHYNFKEVPVVKCGPHEFGNPNLSGKDFQYQTEELVRA